MDYALIENGVVTNLIWLHPNNAGDFPNAVPMGDTPAAIGDTWDGERFWRDGEPVVTALEQASKTIAELDAALLDTAYENIMGTL